MEEQTGIEAAVEAAGSQRTLAALTGVTQQAVAKWVRRGHVPVLRAVEVEQATGVPRARLLDPKVLEVLDTSGI